MKQRVTYIVTKPHDFRPEQVKVAESKDSLHINGVEAAKERRITLGLDELPNEISVALQKWHEIHVRWASPSHYVSAPPFTSRVSSGLHVFFTSLESTPERALCEQLHSIISKKLKCSSTNATSTKLPILSERFSMSTASEYYAYLPSISDTLNSLRQRLCKEKNQTCLELFSDLSGATYLDINYDTITRALVVTAGWPSLYYADDNKREVVNLREGDGTIEIGVLMHEPNPDPEDVQFGGFLTVLGQDATPKATRFQAPARHYPLLSASKDTSQPPTPHPLTFTTAFQHPTGLHPTLLLAFPKQHLTPPGSTCKLHAHLTLPSYLFIDKYQFSDALFLRSKNLKRLRSLAGAMDLEAPDWVVEEWGSAALFELAHPTEESTMTGDVSWNVSIPMHLRYLPASNSSHSRVPVPWPVVFWACRAEEGAKMVANPFDRVHLGYEALFGPKTRFMHVQPAKTEELVEYIDVPVLDLRKTGWVETVTVVTIVAAFVGLCWVLFGRLGPEEVTKGKKKE